MQILKIAAISSVVFTSALSAEQFSADVWADNWFALSVNGEQVAEDSVSINTERSFNSESFTFEATAPFVLGLTAKDYKENDTGLEYIGSKRQQMGDGGVIMQIKNSSGETVIVTNSDWSCLVTHTAPLDKSCEKSGDPDADCGFSEIDEPTDWNSADFDASGWDTATVHSSADVDPKIGYDDIKWDGDAEFIWGPDLETNNTVLCRLVVE